MSIDLYEKSLRACGDSTLSGFGGVVPLALCSIRIPPGKTEMGRFGDAASEADDDGAEEPSLAAGVEHGVEAGGSH